jgi:amidase
MTPDEYKSLDGTALAALIANGQTTAGEVLETAINIIEAENPALNAVVHIAHEEARAAAKLPAPGPFAGVPFLIKDLGLEVKGWPRTSGSQFALIAADAHDSELIKRYRQAGLILLGKTNTPEFGITGTTESARLGPCRNPWNTAHIAGGSSGGAAAAVASGMVSMAHASDGLGSIRIPAACCGLVGLKPTRDRNPNGQNDYDRAVGNVVDHIVCRTVRDSAAMLDATGYPEPDAPHAPAPKSGPYIDELNRAPGRLRIAWCETMAGETADAEVMAALTHTADTLACLGHDIVHEPLNADFRRLYALNRIFAGANFGAIFDRFVEHIGRPPQPAELEPLTWAILQASEKGTAKDAMRAWQDFRMACREVLGQFTKIDVYLSPVMTSPAPEIGYIDPVSNPPALVGQRQTKLYPYAWPFNFTGQPSISLPLVQSAGGLPIGMMFTARYGDEATLFRLAAQLEKEMPWKSKATA